MPQKNSLPPADLEQLQDLIAAMRAISCPLLQDDAAQAFALEVTTGIAKLAGDLEGWVQTRG